VQKIKRKRYTSYKKRASGGRNWILYAGLLFIVIGLVGLLEVNNKLNIFGGQPLPKSDRTIGQTTKGEAEPETEAKNDDSKKQEEPGSTAKKLLAPAGDFVSNHEPNLDGSPAPNMLESVCVTTPGASCTISFERSGIIKTLPAQTTDAEGAAYWNWKLQDYGLTEGEWNITAKATLDDQTKTSQDSLKLNVKP
jgi:hypothetical protein